MDRFVETLLENVVFLMFVLPLVGAALVTAASRMDVELIRRTVLTNVLLTCSLAVLMVANYDPQRRSQSGTPELYQMVTVVRWLGAERIVETDQVAAEGLQHIVKKKQITGPGIKIAVGVDGISLWPIALTAVLMLSAVLAGWNSDHLRPASFYALLLLLESAMIGVFAALDVVLFYVCLEFSLLPLFFLIGGWGGYQRRQVARKFFVYNLAGSLLVFVGLIAVVLAQSQMSLSQSNPHPPLTFSIPRLTLTIPLLASDARLAAEYWDLVGPWIFLALLIGFAIKLAAFPFHTWLPAANVEAPAAVSMLLTGVALKIGCYGFLRFLLPLFPNILIGIADWLLSIAIVAVVYGGLLTLAQNDIKKLVTYSCVSQLGFCSAGIFSLNVVGISGGLLQLINHGLSVGAVLFLVGVLEGRYQTREIEAFGGLTRAYPRLGFFFIVAALSIVAVPGLNGFAGESLTLLGVFQSNPFAAFWGLIGLLLIAWAFLWLIQRSFQGRFREPLIASPSFVGNSSDSAETGQTTSLLPSHTHRVPPTDLTGREMAGLLPLMLLIVWIGLYPQFFVSRISPSVSRILSVYPPAGVRRNVPAAAGIACET